MGSKKKTTKKKKTAKKKTAPRPKTQLKGDPRMGAAYRAAAKLNLELDVDLTEKWRAHVAGYGFYDAAYRINGRSNYSNEVLNDYERETFQCTIQGRLRRIQRQCQLSRSVDLKLGRQIVA